MAATSGEDALRVALRARPSLVLLDVLMPGIDGYETCRRLKGDPATADAAVIFLSALEDAREKVRGLEAGAVDFVTKPFEPEEVLARVHTHLTVQRLQRQLAGRNAELQRELAVAQELLTEARRRVDGPLLGDSPAARALRESIASQRRPSTPLSSRGRTAWGRRPWPARFTTPLHARVNRSYTYCALLAAGQSSGSIVAAAGALDPAAPQLSQLDLAERGTLFLEEIHRMPAALQQSLAPSSRRRSGSESEASRRPRTCASWPAPRGLFLPREASTPRFSRGSSPDSSAYLRSPRGPRTSPTSPVSSFPSTPGGSERWSSVSLTTR